MRLHKLKASESTGTYLVESPVTETDILLMARQLANLRLRRERALTSPKEVFSHLQAQLGDYEHEAFALLLLDSRHRVIVFHELFRGTLDSASVYPRKSSRLPWSTTPQQPCWSATTLPVIRNPAKRISPSPTSCGRP